MATDFTEMAGTDPRWIETYMVRRFHPRRILIDAASLPWVVYLLWAHDWVAALVVGLLAGALGIVATRTVDAKKYSRTLLGRMALLHLNPTNIMIQAAGLVAMVGALWDHSTVGILGSLSLIFLGHMAGWDRVWNAKTDSAANQTAA
ncbi:MAG: hypothetical protein ACXVB9_00840 [Bdellovibrionota bacterium]